MTAPIRAPLPWTCTFFSTIWLALAPRPATATPVEEGASSEPPIVTDAATDTVVAAPSPEPDPVVEDPLILHALGLDAELDHKPDEALELLRRAAALASNDEIIAFDLARVAFETQSPTLEQDSAAFLAMTPTDPQSALLHAYLHQHRGDRVAAQRAAAQALTDLPDDPEALALQARVSTPSPGGRRTVDMEVMGRTALVADSNVTVDPDDATTETAGIRARWDAALALETDVRDLRVASGVGFGFAPHLNRGSGLSLYDASDFGGFVRVTHVSGALIRRVDVSARMVHVHDFRARFMTSGTFRTETTYAASRLMPSVFGTLTYRDFKWRNRDPLTDRDGPVAEGGTSLRLLVGPVRAHASLGVRTERTDGAHRRAWGPFAAVSGWWRRGPFAASAALRLEYRRYHDSDDNRLDQRLSPAAHGFYSLDEQSRVFVAYAFVRNRSKARYEYSRHIGRVGLEMRWP